MMHYFLAFLASPRLIGARQTRAGRKNASVLRNLCALSLVGAVAALAAGRWRKLGDCLRGHLSPGCSPLECPAVPNRWPSLCGSSFGGWDGSILLRRPIVTY